MRFHSVCTALFLFATAIGDAAAFAGYVVPARYEIKGVPGQISRQVLEIGNDAVAPDDFAVKTADWSLTPAGGVEFESDRLLPGSCRSWVKIERHTVSLPAKSKKKYRFEIHVPAEAKPQECRFAMLIERASDVLPTVTAGGRRHSRRWPSHGSRPITPMASRSSRPMAVRSCWSA